MGTSRECPDVDLEVVLASDPIETGRSKVLYAIDEDYCLTKLRPTLDSFTYDRHRCVPGTAALRLDFYELAVERLEGAGVPAAFCRRTGPDTYVAERCSSPPFEVIVKNVAVGSSTRKYPGLFREGYRFRSPVVKFDFRVDPEDQPIAEDYIREAGYPSEEFREIALKTNDVLRDWLAPRDLLDFCTVIGQSRYRGYVLISEVSPDCMRLRSVEGEALDKDLFRHGATGEEIIAVWSDLVERLRQGS